MDYVFTTPHRGERGEINTTLAALSSAREEFSEQQSAQESRRDSEVSFRGTKALLRGIGRGRIPAYDPPPQGAVGAFEALLGAAEEERQ